MIKLLWATLAGYVCSEKGSVGSSSLTPCRCLQVMGMTNKTHLCMLWVRVWGGSSRTLRAWPLQFQWSHNHDNIPPQTTLPLPTRIFFVKLIHVNASHSSPRTTLAAGHHFLLLFFPQIKCLLSAQVACGSFHGAGKLMPHLVTEECWLAFWFFEQRKVK